MSSRREIPGVLRTGPFLSAQAHENGLSYEQLRSKRFTRVLRDVYVSSELELTTELRCQAAVLVLPRDAAFCGVTAARLYGLPVPDDDERTHVAVPAARTTAPRRRGLAVHEITLPAEHLRRRNGLNVVSPEWLFLDLAGTLRRVDRVIAGDALLHRDLATPVSLEKLVHASAGRRGVRRARDTLPLLEPNTDSPMETRLRLIIMDAGLPRPLANANVYDDWGEWIARPDFLYPRARIAIEYEGAHHRTDAARYGYDMDRGDLLAQHGYLILRYQARHVFHQPHRIADGVRYALDRRLRVSVRTDT